MKFKTQYRALADVRILHSFYLENDVNHLFYNLTKSEQAERIIKGNYDVRADFDIILTDDSKENLNAFGCVLVPNATGFIVATKIKIEDNKEKPKIDLPENWRITCYLMLKKNDWRTFTNIRIKPASDLPNQFFWTNDNDVIGKTMPSLALPLTEFDSQVNYEMGEWAMHNNVPLRAHLYNESWQNGEIFNNYISERDRRALPKIFNYALKSPSKTVKVTLTKTINGSQFKVDWVYSSVVSDPLSNIVLDMRFEPAQIQTDGSNFSNTIKSIPNGCYNLSITTDDNTFTYHDIILHDSIVKPTYQCLGYIELIHKNGLPKGQNLLDTEGGLLNGGQKFELRFQNRMTYWQYRESKLGTITGITDNVTPNVLGEDLATLRARGLTRVQTPIDYAENIKLPSPTHLTLEKRNNREYTEIVF
ncbi:MAG: hypothetical protein JNL70_25790 [Saprospiraceae bacterium]|nr:hypothetical protein [Saprospiraceae bacterium]